MRRIAAGFLTACIRLLLAILCRIDARELDKLPREGPALFIMNHVNFLEVPLVYLWLRPRRVYSFIKAETWKNPVLALLADHWDAIPLKRGMVNKDSFTRAAAVFSSAGVLLMAPEGTRSGDGVLRKGYPGAVVLAVENSLPVWPIAHSGGERFFGNLKRLRRTPFKIRVGDPFRFSASADQPLDSETRRRLTDAMMNRLAALLPVEQRGAYTSSCETWPADLLPVNPVSPPREAIHG